ncbi:hypothetical protein N9B88_01075 [Rubripirellula sp.]|nr:hypothetical protein [Rubripirellula sp.]
MIQLTQTPINLGKAVPEGMDHSWSDRIGESDCQRQSIRSSNKALQQTLFRPEIVSGTPPMPAIGTANDLQSASFVISRDPLESIHDQPKEI